MATIYTEMIPGFTLRNWDQSALPDLAGPVIFLIRTDSYSASKVSAVQKSLSAQELEKAQRFRFIKDQHRYILTHGMLRTILGKYLKSEPSEIEFISNEFGKPSLSEKFKKIHFNLSHCSGISVLAFSAKSEIGIDIEKIDPEFDFDLIAKAHFSQTENSFIHEIQGEEPKRFYTLWTRKEAILKAVGMGIGENLDVGVFKEVNRWKPKTFFPDSQNRDFFLATFEMQGNFMVTTAGCSPEKFNCTVMDLTE